MAVNVQIKCACYSFAEVMLSYAGYYFTLSTWLLFNTHFAVGDKHSFDIQDFLSDICIIYYLLCTVLPLVQSLRMHYVDMFKLAA